LNTYHRRQLLPECYRLNGVVDVMRTDIITNIDDMYGDKIGYVALSEYDSVDIDNQFDFELCQFMIQRNQNCFQISND